MSVLEKTIFLPLDNITPAEQLQPENWLQQQTWQSLNWLKTQVAQYLIIIAKIYMPLCPATCTRKDLLKATNRGMALATNVENNIKSKME